MTGSISRKLYRQFLFLYPESFRQEFGNEMLEMFEDCRAAQGSWRLLADLFFSAIKQQISYPSTPFEKTAPPLYAEVAWSPKLARILALSTLSVALIAATVAGRAKAKAPEPWTLIHVKHQLWFQRTLPRPSCSDTR